MGGYPSKQKKYLCLQRGSYGGVGLALAIPAFEKAKGICIKMLHLKYIFTP